jgi:hypothetical protein
MATVGELLTSLLPRIPKANISMSFLDAMQAALDIIVKRLWLKHSDLIKTPLNPDISVAAETDNFTLPSDYLGFVEPPFVTYGGATYQLQPLPPASRYSFPEPGQPQYYELLGSTVYLYPTPDSSISVKGLYYMNPPKLTALSSTIPFNGLFDQVFRDVVLMVGGQGIAIIVQPQFEAFMRSQVDQVLQLHSPKRVGFFQERTGRQSWRGGY